MSYWRKRYKLFPLFLLMSSVLTDIQAVSNNAFSLILESKSQKVPKPILWNCYLFSASTLKWAPSAAGDIARKNKLKLSSHGIIFYSLRVFKKTDRLTNIQWQNIGLESRRRRLSNCVHIWFRSSNELLLLSQFLAVEVEKGGREFASA